jgi:hypothetical protein
MLHFFWNLILVWFCWQPSWVWVSKQNIDKEFKEQLKDLYVKQENYEYKKECVRKTVSPKREDTVKLQYVYTNLCQKFNYKICFTMSMEFARGKAPC